MLASVTDAEDAVQGTFVRLQTVNGELGVVFTSDGAVIHVVSLRIEGGVRTVYMTNNPDNLSRWLVGAVD
jgi:hypothetical protein